MNAALDTAWKAAKPPFHDKAVVVEGYVSVALLSKVLLSFARHIELGCPHADLRIAADWHAHDGYQVEGDPISFSDFAALAASEDLLRKKSPEDFKVFLALYPSTLDFLLRFRVLPADELSEGDSDLGEFDFAGFGNDVLELKKRLSDFPEISYRVVNASEHFRSIYAG
jgi:hypothetical protein